MKATFNFKPSPPFVKYFAMGGSRKDPLLAGKFLPSEGGGEKLVLDNLVSVLRAAKGVAASGVNLISSVGEV